MSSDHLLFEKKDNIVTITLNRPKIMNAMSAEMTSGLYDARHAAAGRIRIPGL